jgi:hypothetical protein
VWASNTHGDTYHGAIVDSIGRHLGDREFPATALGFRGLFAWATWATSFGQVERGVEGIGPTVLCSPACCSARAWR